MWRIIWFFLGWRRVRLTGASPQWSLNALSARRVAFRDVARVDEFTIETTILTRDFDAARAAAERAMCQIDVLKSGGFGVTFAGLRRRWGLVLLLTLAVAVAALFLPHFVLFYEVSGNETVPEELILRNLKELGVGFGTYGPSIKPQWIKNHMLRRIPKLQWITITQNGCCAKVIVRERPETPTVNDRKTPRNVVASRAGVLTRVSVLEGNALCKVGDVVGEGELLVSAYTDFGYKISVSGALAEIYAETSRRSCAVIPDKTLKKVPNGEKRTQVSLVIGQKRVNIFGNSSIQTPECDKITTYRTLTLAGGYTFPITLEITHISGYDTVEEDTDAAWAQQMMRQLAREDVQRDMIAGQILSESFSLEHEGGGLRLYSVFSCEEMIARMTRARILEDDTDANS